MVMKKDCDEGYVDNRLTAMNFILTVGKVLMEALMAMFVDGILMNKPR